MFQVKALPVYNPSSIEPKWPAYVRHSRTTAGKLGKLYSPQTIEKKWRQIWEKYGINKTDLKGAKKPFYNLMMYPYPSAEGLHIGNVYAFTGADIYGRYQRMKGFDVFEPIGFDSGGIHSENYAIKVGVHPKIQIPKNVRHFREQLHKIGNMYDWDHTVDVMEPAYYKWTQWLFTQLFKAGLAYKKKASVTWCPSCKTTLSDEQTERLTRSLKVSGPACPAGRFKGLKNKEEEIIVCERCKTPVIKKELEQWFLAITKYAERLLQNTYKLDWTEKVLLAQRNWIGKSEGAELKFQIPNSKFQISVFTTRPDTLHGCTFMCVAPEFPQLDQLIKLDKLEQKRAVEAYVKQAQTRSEMERKAGDKEKTGVFTGAYAVNPANGEKLPVYVADYVLMEYGSGVVMGVPGHDSRDWEFAKKYKLPIKQVVQSVGAHHDAPVKCYEGEGVLVNSGPWNGWRYPEDLNMIINWLEKKGCGERAVHFKLHDWCISRQRYWGPPIPMVFCPKCGWVPVPEDQLPVLLPDTDDYLPGEAGGKSPLARVPEFVKTQCPGCAGPARRETDVSDTFLDSSWYFLRYPSTLFTSEMKELPFDPSLTKKWLPVTQYTGGAEHSVLHLLYSRFVTMAMHDLGYLSFEEPFPKFYAHGLIIKDGAKMSKSRGNIVNPDEYIAKFGADALRMYLMFLGPFNAGGDFRDTGMKGMFKFLTRVWKLCNKIFNFQFSIFNEFSMINYQTKDEAYWVNKTIKKVGEDIAHFKYNTAIAALMQMVNFLSTQKAVSLKALRALVLVLSPFAPYMTEELNSKLQITNSKFTSVHHQPWPAYDPASIKEDKITIIIQINGKVRDKLLVESGLANFSSRQNKEKIMVLVKKSDKVQKFLTGRPIRQTIFVPGKLVNFVV